MSAGDLLYLAAATLPYWRGPAVMALAGVVIGALYLYVSLLDL